MVTGDKDGMPHLIRFQEGSFSVKAMGRGSAQVLKEQNVYEMSLSMSSCSVSFSFSCILIFGLLLFRVRCCSAN